jgi:hypothetical protein
VLDSVLEIVDIGFKGDGILEKKPVAAGAQHDWKFPQR